MRVRDLYGETGTVVLTLNGLDEAYQHGVLGPNSDYARLTGDTTGTVTDWLNGLERPPRTPRDGRWFVVEIDDDGGQVIVGALDVTYLDN